MPWHQIQELEVVEAFSLQVCVQEVQLEASLDDQTMEWQLDDVVVEDLLVENDNRLVVLEVVRSLDYSHDYVLYKKKINTVLNMSSF